MIARCQIAQNLLRELKVSIIPILDIKTKYAMLRDRSQREDALKAQDKIQAAINRLEQRLYCLTFAEAKKIIGRGQIIGKEEVEELFELNIPWSKIPLVPFTKRELQAAKKRGEFLVLRSAKDKYGAPFDLGAIATVIDKKFRDTLNIHSRMLNLGRYERALLASDTPVKNSAHEFEWALVATRPITDSIGQNAIWQTITLANDVIANRMSEVPVKKRAIYQEALREWRQFYRHYFPMLEFKGEVEEKRMDLPIARDWDVLNQVLDNERVNREITQKLPQLKIHQLFGYKPIQAFYDWLLLLYHEKQRWSDWTAEHSVRTNALSSDGKMIMLGIDKTSNFFRIENLEARDRRKTSLFVTSS